MYLNLSRRRVMMWMETFEPAYAGMVEQYVIRHKFGLSTRLLDEDWMRVKRIEMHARAHQFGVEDVHRREMQREHDHKRQKNDAAVSVGCQRSEQRRRQRERESNIGHEAQKSTEDSEQHGRWHVDYGEQRGTEYRENHADYHERGQEDGGVLTDGFE